MKPDFDLFRFNVRKNGTLSNELLPSQRSWFWAFCIDSLQGFHLLWCISHILASIHLLFTVTSATIALSVHQKRHSENPTKLWAFEFVKVFVEVAWTGTGTGTGREALFLSHSSRLWYCEAKKKRESSVGMESEM